MLGKISEIHGLIEPVIEQMGYELLGIERVQNGRHVILRVYIDKPEGINLDDCAKVSHQVSGVLDVEEPISGAYDLEVSSPGMDRPLFRLKDFVKFTGHRASVKLSVPLNGRRNFKGLIKGIEGSMVLIHVDDVEHKLLFDHIEKARLVPEF